jgi:hypothetical protein
MRRNRVTQYMTRRWPRDAGRANGVLHRSLHDRLVQMMTSPLPCRLVDIEPSRWKHPLPRPLTRRIGIFRTKRARKRHAPTAARDVRRVLSLDPLQMSVQRTSQSRGHNVTRSLPPFPSRTTSSPRSKCTSLTLSSTHWRSRSPEPYINDAISHTGPRSCPSSAATSARDSTVGSRTGRCARTISLIRGSRTDSAGPVGRRDARTHTAKQRSHRPGSVRPHLVS